MFSDRTPADLAPNRLSAAVKAARDRGRSPVDLTESNPTRAGFDYPPDLLTALSDPIALTYAPEPFGSREARAAVSADFARRKVAVDPDRIVLTASTSEAYSLLFKILCDPGDELLTPRPSYALFEHLARLDAAVSRPYDLDYDSEWSIDLGHLERQLSDRARAVLLVSPNNPTGSFVKSGELDAVAGLAAEHGLAIIADEVFADYELEAGAAARAAQILGRNDALVFSLGGLSKSIGLPQAKLGWIAVAGPPPQVRSALARLELACDTYLSVSTPVQCAAGSLLERGAAIRRQIQSRVSANYRCLVDRGGEGQARVLRAEGGWYAVLQVPSLCSEEELVLDLLQTSGVLVHPGYFFDFPRESYLVVSLLPPPAIFGDGVARILRHFECRVGRP
jgi:hypothetical protein